MLIPFSATSTKRLNLGCGLQVLSGFDNLDSSPNVLLSRMPRVKSLLYRFGIIKDAHMVRFPTEIIWSKLPAALRRYPDGSADRIYTSHFIEHLTINQAEKMLA